MLILASWKASSTARYGFARHAEDVLDALDGQLIDEDLRAVRALVGAVVIG